MGVTEVRSLAMNGDVLEVLKEIRDEAKQTNVRLASLEGRVEFLEKRTTKGFENLNEELQAHGQRIDEAVRHQAEIEIRLTTEVVSLSQLIRDVRDVLQERREDHLMMLNHEERITSLESRAADQGEK